MKRETIIASVLGISLGAVVAGCILVGLSFQQEEKDVIANVENSVTPSVVPREQRSFSFDIESPENEIVLSSESVTIEGTATTESLIVIQSPTDQQVLEMTEEQFNTSFPLSVGENVIVVSFYPPGSTTVFEEKELFVYYIPQ